MLHIDEENIRKWHKIVLEYMNSGSKQLSAYCKDKGVEVQKFLDMKYRLFYKQDSDPKVYAELLHHSNQLKSSDYKISEYCKKYNVNQRLLAAMNTHLNYKAVIDRMDLEEKSAMTFIPVKQLKDSPTPRYPDISQEVQRDVAELLEKQNDIELTISAGIKVCISPNVSSMKIIRIIELLKDL